MSFIYKPKRMVSKVPGKERTGFYATKVAAGLIDTNLLCKHISQKTSMSSADVKGVVEALVNELGFHLQYGHSVQVGDLGIFSSTVTSPVVDSPKELTSKKVRIKSITFLPSVRMKDMMRETDFIRLRDLQKSQGITPCDADEIER